MKIKKIRFLFLIIILSILCLFVFVYKAELIGLIHEQKIGEYIIKNTPVGTSRNDVRTFIKNKGYEIMWDNDFPHMLRPDVVMVPEQPPQQAGGYSNPENSRGAKHIFASITKGLNIVDVMCVWVFDDDEKLLFIGVSKEWSVL